MAILEHISLKPSLEAFCELFTSVGKVVFCSKGITALRLPLVLRNVSPVQGFVHDELQVALPDRCKGQVPEIAIDQGLILTAESWCQ